jgi:ribosomal-protein-alanine N-acetyltransferase
VEGYEPIEIRRMSEKDLDEVLDIERESFPTPWSKGLFAKELAIPFARAFVAQDKDSGKIVGYLCFWLVDQETHILNLAVHPRRRGEGIGTRLLAFGVTYCRRQGVQQMTLEVRRSNVKAISLYKNFQFHPQGVRRRYYTDSGEDAIVMGLDLEKEKSAAAYESPSPRSEG